MANTYGNLNDLFTAIATEIRTKKGYGSNVKIKADDFPSEVSGISTSGTVITGVSLVDSLYAEADFVNSPGMKNIAKSFQFSPVSGAAHYVMAVEVTRGNQVVGTALESCNDVGTPSSGSTMSGTVILAALAYDSRTGKFTASATVSKGTVSQNQFVSIRVYAIL